MKIALTARIALALAGLLLLQPNCNAESKATGSKTKETPDKAVTGAKPQQTQDKVSYSIGADIGSNLKKSDLDLNVDFLAQGIKDSFAGKTVMTEEEMKATLDAFKTDMQAKMQAKQKVMAEKNKGEGEKFLEENKKKEGVVTTPSGLQYKVLKAGTGPKPKLTDTVAFNYKGSLINGKVFDQSKEPLTIPLEGLIPAWVEALQMMPTGSKWELYVPASLAYGERGAPPVIEPNSTLIFEVELVDIKKPEAAPEGAKPAESPAAKAK